ncbi:MAG: BrnA antitoxin family protein [Deltaproteobacteria bacterium]|nr:BrnA antitoxin family protein [Deltaproteobacteria bacterium]
MIRYREFPFERARRATSEELKKYRKAIERTLGVKRKSRGRPPKLSRDKYLAVSIRLHPLALSWVRGEARKRGVGYQTVINQILLKQAA